MLDRNTVALSPSIEADRIAAIAKALAHPARVRIIAFLLSKPGCIGGDIVDQVGLAQSTVSEHLRILKDAGIVTGTIDYPRICYALDSTALAPIRRFTRRTEAIAGTYSTEEEAARRERTRRAALAWVERGPGRDDPRVDQLVNEYLDALLVLDPLEVLDDDGELVGYWAEEFIPLEEYEERRAEGAATIERLEGS